MGAYRKVRRTGLNRIAGLRRVLVALRRLWLTRIFGMDIDPSAEFSLSAAFDQTFPGGVHVGPKSYIAFEAA